MRLWACGACAPLLAAYRAGATLLARGPQQGGSRRLGKLGPRTCQAAEQGSWRADAGAVSTLAPSLPAQPVLLGSCCVAQGCWLALGTTRVAAGSLLGRTPGGLARLGWQVRAAAQAVFGLPATGGKGRVCGLERHTASLVEGCRVAHCSTVCCYARLVGRLACEAVAAGEVCACCAHVEESLCVSNAQKGC